MTNTFLILLPIALFLVMLMGLSLWAERAGRRNRFAGEYFLGDRSLKGFVLAMTLVATYGSVSSFVSGPGLAWQLGLGWVVFAAPQIIAGFLILGVAGKKMAVVSRAAGALTVIDMIRARYGDGRGGRTRLLHDDDDRSVHRRRTDLLEGRGRELRLGGSCSSALSPCSTRPSAASGPWPLPTRPAPF